MSFDWSGYFVLAKEMHRPTPYPQLRRDILTWPPALTLSQWARADVTMFYPFQIPRLFHKQFM
jgi:hypothetical protein